MLLVLSAAAAATLTTTTATAAALGLELLETSLADLRCALEAMKVDQRSGKNYLIKLGIVHGECDLLWKESRYPHGGAE